MKFIIKELKGDCYERFATVEALADGRKYNVHFEEEDECLGSNGDWEIHKRKIGDVLNATLCLVSEFEVEKGGVDAIQSENDTSYYVTALVQINNKVEDEFSKNVYMANASWCAEPVKVNLRSFRDFELGDYLTLDGSLELEIEE